jgi:carbon monoxide dehydrogenase subunit G
MKAVIGVVVVIVVLVAGFVGYKYWQLQQMAAKYKDAKEVVAESIEKDGSKWSIHMESVIGKPVDKVWRAVNQPERSQEFIPAFKKSELKKSEGNKKVVEFQVQVLTLPLQTFVAELTFDEANHRMSLKTLSGPQDQTATYQFTDLGGEKTLLVYDATATDKVNVPLPLSVQKGAVKELFVNQVRAIMKGIDDEEKKQKAAARPPRLHPPHP